MKEEKEALSKGATALLWFLAIIVELVMSWVLLILNGLTAIMRGYWSFFWIFFVVWAIASFLWISTISVFISKKKWRKIMKKLREEW